MSYVRTYVGKYMMIHGHVSYEKDRDKKSLDARHRTIPGTRVLSKAESCRKNTFYIFYSSTGTSIPFFSHFFSLYWITSNIFIVYSSSSSWLASCLFSFVPTFLVPTYYLRQVSFINIRVCAYYRKQIIFLQDVLK